MSFIETERYGNLYIEARGMGEEGGEAVGKWPKQCMYI
jgi:hypothetical protein